MHLRKPHVSRRGIEFIIAFEGFNETPIDIGDGALTIGFGTTSAVTPVKPGMVWSRREARKWLRRGLAQLIVPNIPRVRQLRQREIDALASFGYNLGPGVFSYSKSTLARRMISSEGAEYHDRCRIYEEELIRWVSAGSPFEDGLRRRRMLEVRIALTGRYGVA